RSDVVPADGQNVEVAGGLRVGIGDGNLGLRRLWAGVMLLHERWFAAAPTGWWRAGPKRCRLHQPPGGAQRGRYVIGPWRVRHPVLDNIRVRLRNDSQLPSVGGAIETGPSHSGGEQQF